MDGGERKGKETEDGGGEGKGKGRERYKRVYKRTEEDRGTQE